MSRLAVAVRSPRAAYGAKESGRISEELAGLIMTVSEDDGEEYAAQTEFKRPLVDSTFTLALVTGLSVSDLSQNAVNLGWEEVRLPAPVFEGDTIYARSEVLTKLERRNIRRVGQGG
jgi:hypothetical protein